MKKKLYFKYRLPKHITNNYKRKKYNNRKQITIIKIIFIKTKLV